MAVNQQEETTFSSLSLSGTGAVGSSLMQMLVAGDIQPGSDPSYQLCKTIYLYHPLGQKMAESPVAMAQSQERQVAVQDAPDEVAHAFLEEWEKLDADGNIANVHSLARVYGIASLVLLIEGEKTSEPLDMTKIWDKEISFNVLDPLNTAGSLVLNQVPTAADFNKPSGVVTNNEKFHRSRYQVVMNERPIYIAYTGSAFGFVGRSVYQRALYPLKSFIRTMIADDMIATKLGLLVAKQKQPGSIVNAAMSAIAALKRNLLKRAQTNNVLSIEVEEAIETLNMQNVDGAGTYSRTNILKNVATAADMPAKLLENETMVAGFGEGTEDAKNIARYVDRVRYKLRPTYTWFDNLVQYRAWNKEFYASIQGKYPQYEGVQFADAFSQWRKGFSAEWPSVLIEPESEQIKVEQTKLEALIALLETLTPLLDPMNQMEVIQTALDNINENKRMFPHEFSIDTEELEGHLEELQKQASEQLESGTGLNQAKAKQAESSGAAKKLGRFSA